MFSTLRSTFLKVLSSLILCLIAFTSAYTQSKASAEIWETSKNLGVAVKDFPKPQGVGGFDDISTSAPEFLFKVVKRPLTGLTPRPSYETRLIVKARATDGTIYEALCARYDAKQIWPGPGESSSNMNARQQYDTHYGYGFSPADVFIGKREKGRIRTALFFRDVGSHETAPHYLAVDNQGLVHLILSDVNVSDNNELNVYSVVGDPSTGKWLEAWLLDRRGFTSWSHPWSGGWGSTVHSLWDWGDASIDTENPNMGLFYVDRTSTGFGRKTRVISGLIESFDAAIDPTSGRLVIAVARKDAVFVVSRKHNGGWTKPAAVHASLKRTMGISIIPMPKGAFVVRTDQTGGEYVIAPS